MNGNPAWSDALLAIALFAADPAGLGGIALRARAGPVRERWLQLLASALTPARKLCRVPAHIDDDRLLGGLDLAASLQAGRPVVQAGLLAQADGGVLVLAMAERTEPAVAARICAAMDRGIVTPQRDGIAGSYPASFGIIALDEGADQAERPPQSLLDRLAFHVDLAEVAIGDTAGAPTRAASKPMTETARDAAIDSLCKVALALGIASIRAPLLALRAADIVAARDGRTGLSESDLATAARLVLAPRAMRLPPDPDEAPPNETTAPNYGRKPADDPDTEDAARNALAEIVLEAAHAALPSALLADLGAHGATRQRSRTLGRSGDSRDSLVRGRPIGARPGRPRNGARLHVIETLKAAAPWQALRRQGGEGNDGRIRIRREDFRIIRHRHRIGATTVFAVDASGSAALHRLAEAKGAIELLLADCYVRRDQVALIAFRNNGAGVILPPTTSLVRARRSLSALPGGGATPLAAGIDAAVAVADHVRRAGRTPLVTLLTDGRANMSLSGQGGRAQAEEDALASARQARASAVPALLVDTSPRPNPFARRLAEAMSARYVPLPYADASSVTQAVQSAAAS